MGTNTNELVSLHIFVIIIFCYHTPLVNFIQLAMQLQSQWSLWSSWLRTVDSSLAGNIWTPGQSLPVPIPSRARANAEDNDDLYQSRPATEEGLSKKKSASPWLALTLVKPSEKSPPLHSHPAIIAHRLEAIPNQPRISRPHSVATLLGTTAVSVNRLAKTTVPNPKNPNVTTRKAKRQKNDSSI